MYEILSLLDNLCIHDFNQKNAKEKIKSIFDAKLRNKKFDRSCKTHCGSEGMWIESKFKIDTNSLNYSDFMGYEIKKDSSKITFGDWSANEYVFNQKDVLMKFNGNISINKLDFIKTFGRFNKEKNRYSWSGSVCPSKYNEWSKSGQILTLNSDGDLFILYSYNKDNRRNVEIPEYIKEKNYIILAYWNKNSLKEKIEKKFSNNGTIIIKKNKDGIYDKLCFYNKITFELFIQKIKDKIIIFDSGMYEGNNRNYSQFRTTHLCWENLLDEEY